MLHTGNVICIIQHAGLTHSRVHVFKHHFFLNYEDGGRYSVNVVGVVSHGMRRVGEHHVLQEAHVERGHRGGH